MNTCKIVHDKKLWTYTANLLSIHNVNADALKTIKQFFQTRTCISGKRIICRNNSSITTHFPISFKIVILCSQLISYRLSILPLVSNIEQKKNHRAKQSPSDVIPDDFRLSVSSTGLCSVDRPLAVNCGRLFSLTTCSSVCAFMTLARPMSDTSTCSSSSNSDYTVLNSSSVVISHTASIIHHHHHHHHHFIEIRQQGSLTYKQETDRQTDRQYE